MDGLGEESVENILRTATQAIQAHADHLRSLSSQAKSLWQEGLTEQRQLRQFIEEVDYRLRFAQQGDLLKRGQGNDERLGELQEREESLQQRDAALTGQLVALEALVNKLEKLADQGQAGAGLLIDRVHGGRSSSPTQFALSARVLQGREEERARLAREIHDGPAQILANAIMALEFCQQVSRREPAQLPDELSRLNSLMRNGLSDVRRFIFDLRPASLAETGLKETLERYVADYQQHFGLTVSLDDSELPQRLDSEQETAIFRIVQEALQNVKKHAQASQVWIRFERGEDSALVVSIRDDGRGFSPEQLDGNRTASLGITGMRERAELIKGTLRILSQPGQGSEVVLSIPRILSAA
jgi:two-component system, NarL family, sensor histidine kinase DegS